LEHGPGLYRMVPLIEGMLEEKTIAIQPTDCYGFKQTRMVNLREPDLSEFSGKEIALVDAWIERLKLMTAKEVSLFSHETAAWRVTKLSEIIDPKMVYIAWGEPSAADVKRGQQIAMQHGLLA
jgi:hypothetical protein